jgi:hypothetical protein
MYILGENYLTPDLTFSVFGVWKNPILPGSLSPPSPKKAMKTIAACSAPRSADCTDCYDADCTDCYGDSGE